MTYHPCKGLTKAQTGVFEMIAMNSFPNCTHGTVQKLLDRGLIARRKKLDPWKNPFFVPRQSSTSGSGGRRSSARISDHPRP